MASAVTTVVITHPAREVVATVADRLLRPGTNAPLAALSREIDAIASGASGARVVVQVDGTAGVAASQTIACTQASCTAGDKLLITVPGFPTFTLTAVAGTPNTSTGEYAIITSDTAVAASIKAAINGHTGLRKIMSADNSSGTVTATVLKAGAGGNSIGLVKSVTNSGAFTLGGATFAGGKNAGDRAVAVVVLDQSKLTADDTLRIGKTTLTWKASAGAEGEVTIGASSTAAGDNLVAKINAHSALQGLMTAVNASGTVTITWLGSPRVGEHVYMVKSEATPDAMTLTQMASGSTESYGAAPISLTVGQA
jgi:hypothetical protein